LPHLRDLKPGDVHKLISSGKLPVDFTEKTDGLAFGVGYDKDGFYTRSARSDKVRNVGEYTAYTKRKYGEDHESPFSHHYDEIHHRMQSNQELHNYLKTLHHKTGGEDVSLKGEMFWKPLGEESEKGVKFVGTHYDPTKMGTHGKFVLHSKLPENSIHDHKKVSSLSASDIHFDNDSISNGSKTFDVSDELSQFNSLNHEAMSSRKKADAESKEHENRKFQSIKSSLESKLREHVNNNIKPKFGNETEGVVAHPRNSNAPKFKLVSDSFSKFKQEQMQQKKEG
jgi:hypothetical protein